MSANVPGRTPSTTAWRAAWPRPSTRIFSQTFDCVDASDALRCVDYYLAHPGGAVICAKNVAITVACDRDARLNDFYESAALVAVDGRPLVYLSRWFGKPFPEMLAAKLWLAIIKSAAERGKSLYLLGSSRTTVAAAAAALKRDYPSLHLSGFRDGYFDRADEDDVIDEVRKAKPDILYLGLPTPAKERMAARFARELPGVLVVAVGGILEVIAGEKRHAPELVSRLCLEWVYRIAQDPKRLWRRYLTSNLWFARMLMISAVTGTVSWFRNHALRSTG